MGQLPLYHVSFRWQDRDAGVMFLRVRKSWVPRPGEPSTSRTLVECTYQAGRHTSEAETVAEALLAAAAAVREPGATAGE